MATKPTAPSRGTATRAAPATRTVPAANKQQPNKATAAAEHQRRPAPAAPARPVQQQQRQSDAAFRTPPSNHQQVARREVAGGEQLPDFMRGDADMGKESITREDLETPRLKLIQGLSPELQLYDGLRPGFFFHSATEHIFEGPFVGVPIYMEKQYILWRPRDSGGGILARAMDGVHWSPANTEFEVVLDKKDGGAKVVWRTADTVEQSGLQLWGTQNPDDPNSAPAATQMYNFVLAFPDFPDLMPAAFTFQRSSIKAARKFVTKLKIAQGPIFGRRYLFSPVLDRNKANQEFNNISVTGEGLVQDADEYARYRDMYQSFQKSGLKIKDEEELQTEAEGFGTEEPETEQPPRGGGRRDY